MKQRAVFVHIPRTAGTSIMEFCRESNIYVFGHDINNLKYISLKKFKKNYNKNSYYFTFVRNPWDRVVSSFFYLDKGGNNISDEKDREKYLKKYKHNFNIFIKEAFKNKKILKQIHFMPQNKWIYNKKNH